MEGGFCSKFQSTVAQQKHPTLILLSRLAQLTDANPHGRFPLTHTSTHHPHRPDWHTPPIHTQTGDVHYTLDGNCTTHISIHPSASAGDTTSLTPRRGCQFPIVDIFNKSLFSPRAFQTFGSRTATVSDRMRHRKSPCSTSFTSSTTISATLTRPNEFLCLCTPMVQCGVLF